MMNISAYALACGYVQRIRLYKDDKEIRITLWREFDCYHVRGYEFNGRGRLFWEAFDMELAKARKYKTDKIRELEAEGYKGVP